jgi:hypothetical protein
MFGKHYLTLIIAVLYLIGINDAQSTSYECRIHNMEYKHEYLFTSDELDPNDSYKRKVFTFPLRDIENFDEIKWNLIQVNGMNDTFFIMSYLFDEYLCSSNVHMDYFKMRRKVNLIKMDDERLANEKNCMWKFQSFEASENKFVVWNLNFYEPLYAASALFKNFKSNRNIFTWHAGKVIDFFFI